MPVTVRIEVSGLRELGEKMAELGGPKARGAARSATGAGAKFVVGATRANIIAHPSVRTGSLLNSVIAKKVPQAESGLTSEHAVTYRGKGKATGRGQGTSAPHANLVELGTVHMPAEPSLGPALDNNVSRVVEIIKERLRARLFT